MNAIELDEAKAGKQLDAAIEEEVFGLKVSWTHERFAEVAAAHTDANDGRGIFLHCRGCGLKGHSNEVDWSQLCPTPQVAPYSTEAPPATLVLQHMADQGFTCRLHSPGIHTVGSGYYEFERWWCCFQLGATPSAPIYTAAGDGEGDSFAEAVAIAALAAFRSYQEFMSNNKFDYTPGKVTEGRQ